MKTDKRTFYLWAVVLLANTLVALEIMLSNISRFNISRDNSLLAGYDFIILGVFLFITVVPVLIAGLKSRFKNYFGYYIPAVLFLSASWFLLHYPCRPIFDFFVCGAEPILAFSLIISSAVFVLFYSIGIYARVLNVKFSLALIFVMLIIFLASSLLRFDFNILHRFVL